MKKKEQKVKIERKEKKGIRTDGKGNANSITDQGI